MRSVSSARVEIDIRTRQGSISFLKKRNKKLLILARNSRLKCVEPVPPATDKSFLVLFFKKRTAFLGAGLPND
jgi:hypothetical protein